LSWSSQPVTQQKQGGQRKTQKNTKAANTTGEDMTKKLPWFSHLLWHDTRARRRKSRIFCTEAIPFLATCVSSM